MKQTEKKNKENDLDRQKNPQGKSKQASSNYNAQTIGERKAWSMVCKNYKKVMKTR